MLHWICALGDLPKANAVLSIQGVDVNVQDNAGWTPLMIAGIQIHMGILQIQYPPVKKILWNDYWKSPRRTS